MAPQPRLVGTSRSRSAHDVRIFTPHTTTKVSIVSDASNNALSMEANLITPPFASYPGSTLSDSMMWRQPAANVFPLWLLSHGRRGAEPGCSLFLYPFGRLTENL